MKKLESEDSSDEDDYILNAGDKKKKQPGNDRKSRSKRRSPPSVADSSSSSSSADVITSSQERIVDHGPNKSLYSKSSPNRNASKHYTPKGRSRSPIRREYERDDEKRNYDVRNYDVRNYDVRNYDVRDNEARNYDVRNYDRDVQEKRPSYDKYTKNNDDVYENRNDRSNEEVQDPDYDRELQLKQNRKEIQRFLAIMDESHDISQEDRERIQDWLREKSKETVRMFFNEILERYPYEKYVFHKQKSYIEFRKKGSFSFKTVNI